MTDITIQAENQQDTEWNYQVALDANGKTYSFDVSLSQSDYQAWSEGKATPAEVVRAAFQFLLDREPASSIMSQFDCSVIRRYFPEVDRELPNYIS
jgi:hypothetical protein